ncbi:hypothetical protein ACFL4E_03605 [Candidatus Omnitrophota bacterium]
MSKRNIILIVIGCIVVAAAIFLGTATIHEDGLVDFRVKGRVFAEDTRMPLDGVEVLVLLYEQPTEDKEELDRLFSMYSARWLEVPKDERTGISEKNGDYTSGGARRYSLKYRSFLGARKHRKHPFDKTWIAFRKDGYKDKIIELSTKGWKHSYHGGEYYNPVPDVYLEK